MPLEYRLLFSRGCIPELDRLVPARRRHELVVGGNGDHLEWRLMAPQSEALFAGLDVPDLRGLVLSAGDEGLAMAEKRGPVDHGGVPVERLALLARSDVPELDHLVEAGAHQGR